MERSLSNKSDHSAKLATDFSAGLVVFLVALPLCLGIANASGTSPLSGIIAGVIGGIVIGFLSGSPLSVSGPAAGLVAVVLTAVSQLGGSFQAFQVALVIAGVIQLVLGFLKLGNIANFVPNSVIKGMLAGIGVVIILKQIPHALGRDKDYEGDFAFLSKLGDTFTDIARAVMSASPAAIVIFAISVSIILFWESKWMKKYSFTKLIPGALIAVIVGAIINTVYPAHLALKAEDGHLVVLPMGKELVSSLSMPDWSFIANPQVWVIAITLAVVASLESLLSLEAADKLDEKRRITSPNRELVAQGVGNGFSGLIGGLPITSVVVRTSANASAGAQSKVSTIVHGGLLLLCSVTLAFLLNKIPLACLAAVLIVVGYKLTKPALYKKVWQQGLDQFLPFIVTLLGVVFTDLLKGVLVGMIFGFFFVIRSNQHRAFTIVNDGDDYLIRFNKDITFANKASLRDTLSQIPDNSRVVFQGHTASIVDHDIVEMLDDFAESGQYRGIAVERTEIDGKTWSMKGPNHSHLRRLAEVEP